MRFFKKTIGVLKLLCNYVMACVIGRAKRALHTSESQLRSDTYMFISSKVQRSMRVHSQRLCSNINISTCGAARSSLFCA